MCILAICAGLVGIAGSVIPGLPGPPISWLGMLLLYFWGGAIRCGHTLSMGLLVTMLVVTTIVTVVDYMFPAAMTKATGGSRYASRGALGGMVAGCILTPIGMILGAFLGAFLSELYWGEKNVIDAAKAAVGAFVGVLTGTGLKLAASGVMMWMIIANV